MKNSFQVVLKFSLLLVVAAGSHSQRGSKQSAPSSFGGVVTKFLTWPVRALSETKFVPRDDYDEIGPLLSQKLFRTVPIYQVPHAPVSKENVLFSFKLTGSAARRLAERRGLEAAAVEEHAEHAESTAEHGDTTHSDVDIKEAADSHGDGHDTHSEGAHDDIHDMVVHVTYEDIYSILVFLIVATAMGIFTSKLGMPALVGEIITGFLLGPPLADFVPFPEAMVLVGEIGLIMLLLEAGVELDIGQLKATGTRAVAIGLTGTILPLLVGMGLATATGAPIKSAMAVGASFSPTSLGVAASALRAGKAIDKPVGQLIVASCVVDDILALILLSMFKVLVMDSPPIIQYFIPIISSLGFLVVLGGSAVTWMPKMIENKILNKFNEGDRQLVMFSLMACLMMAYLPLLNYTKASYLTGAFLAGVTFSQVEHAHHQFMENTHHLMTWLLRVFFSASIGFQVPVTQFSDPYVIGWGFIFYLCVAAKLPLMFYVPRFEDTKGSFNPLIRDRLITGLAMTCRGEFSFIIAAFALGEGLFSAQVYAAIVWAVLFSCITSPFMLLNIIKYFNRKEAEYFASTNPHKTAGKDGKIPLLMHITITSKNIMGLQGKFRDILNKLGLEIMDRRTERLGRGLDANVVTDIYVRDMRTTTKVQKIKAQRKIKRALQQAEAGTDAQDKTGSFNREGSMHVSSKHLSEINMNAIDDEEQNILKDAAAQEDAIVRRGEEVERAITEAINDSAEVVVKAWNPWPWTDVLESIADHYGLRLERTPATIDTFDRVFESIDTDDGGEIDTQEMYSALVEAGMDISEEGVDTLFGIIDEDGNGTVEQHEWNTTVDFFLELKEEEAARRNQQLHGTLADEEEKARSAKLNALQTAAIMSRGRTSRPRAADIEKGPVVRKMMTMGTDSEDEA